MDDHPRPEFTVRQRHTLKEFAAIVMREMELWRDKIQLRTRECIQTSMRQFTRECLEIDNEAEQQGAQAQGPGSPPAPPPPTPARNSDEKMPRAGEAAAADESGGVEDVDKTRLTVSPLVPSRAQSPSPGGGPSQGQQQQHQQQPLRTLSAMDRVYERAVRLVKRTLDVEGAIVVDVSTFDVLETTKAEGALSIVCHHEECIPSSSVAQSATAVSAAAPGPRLNASTNGTTNPSPANTNSSTSSGAGAQCELVHMVPMMHTISPEELPLFMELFAKHPKGKMIAEGIVPRAFRALLPTRVQDALSEFPSFSLSLSLSPPLSFLLLLPPGAFIREDCG